jgi:hypothetical protein
VSLFEQPHEWQAIWKISSSHGTKNGVAVFPGLVFLVDGQPSGKSQGFEGIERLRVCKVVVEEWFSTFYDFDALDLSQIVDA